jgi:hypothetical protein
MVMAMGGVGDFDMDGGLIGAGSPANNRKIVSRSLMENRQSMDYPSGKSMGPWGDSWIRYDTLEGYTKRLCGHPTTAPAILAARSGAGCVWVAVFRSEGRRCQSLLVRTGAVRIAVRQKNTEGACVNGLRSA